MSLLLILALMYLKDCRAIICSCDNGAINEDCIETCRTVQVKFENKAPTLFCREVNKLVVAWEAGQQNGTEYLIEYRHQTSQNWKNETSVKIKKIGDKNMISINNITGGYIFRIKMYLEQKLIGTTKESEVFYTLPVKTSLSMVKKAGITNFMLIEQYLATILEWEPVLELVCGYRVVLWPMNNQEVADLIPNVEDLYHMTLVNLFYSTNYQVLLFADTNGYEGGQYQLYFTTPSCNEMNNYDYNICEPEKPLNLSATYKECKVILNWKTPHKFPDSYIMKILSKANGEPSYYMIEGKETSYNIDTSTLSNHYELHLQAIANNKESRAAIITNENRCKVMHNKQKEGTKMRTFEEAVSERIKTEPMEGITSEKLIIIIALFLSLMVMTIVILISYQIFSRYQNRLERNIAPTIKVEDKSDGVKNPRETKEKLTGYDISSNMITLKEVIGKGEFGIVFKASMKKLKEENEVAVKTLRNNASKEDIESFQEEVEVMRTVGKHENLVSLIGYCPKEKLLVVEYCSLGDLQNFLREARKTKLLIQELLNSSDAERNKFWPSDNIVSNIIYERTEIEQKHLKLNMIDLLQLARQVANGMEYLTNNKIIHRDLATRNILLTFDLVAKISDFGLSRDIYEESVYRKKRVSKLPIKWMALESLSHHIFTSQSDVWSFGILLWEVMTLGGAPYPSIPSAEIYKLLKTGYRMEKPPSCNAQVYEIMTSCWKEKPYNRPSFSQIITMLDNILNNESVQNRGSFDTEILNYAHICPIEE